MSDIRFILIGAALIFAGFIIIIAFGGDFNEFTVQMELGECFDYHDDAPPTKVDCDLILQDKIIMFSGALGVIIAGIISMIKGYRGTWDQDVNPEDMVGPSRTFDSKDSPGDDSENKKE